LTTHYNETKTEGYFKDSEGIVTGIMQEDPEAK